MLHKSLSALLLVAQCSLPLPEADQKQAPPKATQPPEANKSIKQPKPKPDTLTVLGVGDMMLGTNFPSASFLPPDDGANLLKPVKPFIEAADIAFGNLEGTFLSADHPGKNCSNPSICYSFKMPDHYVQHFKDAGFDVLSVANNHINDFGERGKQNTVEVLKKAGIHHAGLSFCPTTIFQAKGLTIGFTAFAPNSGTLNFNDHVRAASIVKGLDSICDIVIVSFHGGAEGSSRTHITRKNEAFVGENRGNPYRFARTVIDAGADIVFGHGPHVTRAIDLYHDRIICYSLGNFATYGRFNLSGVSGIAPMVAVSVGPKGEFLSGHIRSIRQPGEGGPVMDDEHRALKEIIQLTSSDIPEAPLDILIDGSIRKKAQK